MTTLRQAAQQALEALEYHVEQTRPIWKTSKAIVALMAALEQEDEIQEMLRTLGFKVQCPESIGITLRRWRDGYAAALAQEEQEQEPVAWMSRGKERLEFSRPDTVYGSHTIPLYTHPPRRTGLPHCERSCEATAFQIEIRRLKAELARGKT